MITTQCEHMFFIFYDKVENNTTRKICLERVIAACGRYQFSQEDSAELRKIIREVQRKNSGVKTGEIFPTNCAPVLVLDDGHISANALHWGFPRFDSKGVVINARAETALEKPMFRTSINSRRCIIPTSGFFEWSQGTQKQKYLFRQAEQPELYLAGIYNVFRGESRFVILTTAANESVVDIHNRMPVVVCKDEQDAWLSDTTFAIQKLYDTPPALARRAV